MAGVLGSKACLCHHQAMTKLPQYLALALIRMYQRHLSPYKGFSCAYRMHTQCASCSALGYRAIRRLGLVDGIGALRKRLRKCRAAHQRYAPPQRIPSKQAGYCDLLVCDAAALYGPDLACLACDFASREGHRDRDEALREMHLPPSRPPRLRTDYADDDTHPTEGGGKQ